MITTLTAAAPTGLVPDPRICTALDWCRARQLTDLLLAAPFALDAATRRRLADAPEVRGVLDWPGAPDAPPDRGAGRFLPEDYDWRLPAPCPRTIIFIDHRAALTARMIRTALRAGVRRVVFTESGDWQVRPLIGLALAKLGSKAIAACVSAGGPGGGPCQSLLDLAYRRALRPVLAAAPLHFGASVDATPPAAPTGIVLACPTLVAGGAERQIVNTAIGLHQAGHGPVTVLVARLHSPPGKRRGFGVTVKKLCWHTTFGEIEVTEPQFREGTRWRRPFARSAQVQHRGCSLPLQRVVTDLGADWPFAQAADKLQAHDGVRRSPSTIRQVTEGHAQALSGQGDAEPAWPSQPGVAIVIAQTDGGMVPLVEVDPDAADRRRGKWLLWKEAKLSLAHAHGSTTPVYAATLNGGVEVAGRQLLACAIAAGMGTNTQVYALGDGATWIADQVATRFGTQGRYTVDFFHVCDYLAEAAKASAPEDPKGWLETQKKRLQSNQVAPVLAALSAALEPVTVADADAPVRACHRDLSNRLDDVDYQGALAQGLPIGSGEIERAHRYVVQQRLKRPGAWWTPHNAQAMLDLRTTRANGQWAAYWQGHVQQPA